MGRRKKNNRRGKKGARRSSERHEKKKTARLYHETGGAGREENKRGLRKHRVGKEVLWSSRAQREKLRKVEKGIALITGYTLEKLGEVRNAGHASTINLSGLKVKITPGVV